MARRRRAQSVPGTRGVRREAFDGALDELRQTMRRLGQLRDELVGLLEGDAPATPDRIANTLSVADALIAECNRAKKVVPAVDRAWRRFAALSSALNPGESGKTRRHASAERRPWRLIPPMVAELEYEVERAIEEQGASWIYAVRSSAVDAVNAPEVELREAVDACRQLSGTARTDAYSALGVATLADELERAGDRWASTWTELISADVACPPGRTWCEAAAELVKEITHSIRLRVHEARSAYERWLGTPRARSMLESFPVGWDRVTPEPAPAQRRYLRHAAWPG